MRAKCVLVVTDDSATRASAAQALAELGYVVAFGRTPAKAVERVRRRPPAAVMVDARVASQGCPTFVEVCRREASPANMPILVMAATPRAAIDAIRAGAQGCVKAPVDSATLLPMLFQVHLPTPN
jgi:two-component system, cell cycle response regulator